jgi:hypothetical protein
MKQKEIKVEVIYTEGYKERFAEALVRVAEKHVEEKRK